MAIEVGKYEIFGMPPYFFFSVLGGCISVCCYMVLLLISKIQLSKKNLFLCLFAVVGVFLGARFFGCLTNIAISLYKKEKIGIGVIYRAGLVFYGGLFGGLFFYWIVMRLFFQKNYHRELINSLAICIPLFHCFGRLGCLFAGCCYGIEYHGYGHIVYIRNGVVFEAFPIQLVEFVVEILIFLSLIVKHSVSTKKESQNILIIYFIEYALCRFFLEFWRGDSIRGLFGVLSFSQIISIIVFVFCLIIILRKMVKI